MKNQFNIITLFFLVSFFLSNQTNAQYASIFGEENTSIQILTIDNQPTGYSTTQDAFFSNNTISIDQTSYHEFIWNTKHFTSDWEELETVYYLRENTATGQVWLLATDDSFEAPSNTENEILVIDMSLEIGDEFLYYISPTVFPESTVNVTVIDVYYENDKKHIVFDRTFDPSFGDGLEGWETQNLMFIEGVGSNFGFYHFYEYGLMSCVQKNSTLYYESAYQPLADLCDLETFSSTTEEFTNTSLYPNPSTTYFQVNYPSEIGTSELKVFNLQGKLILQKPSYQQESIDVTNFSSGVYFVELTSREGEVWRKKLIKE